MNKSNRKLKEIVQLNLGYMGSLSLDETIEIIRPHCEFNVHKLIEAELRREARRIIGSFKDTDGNKIYCIDRSGDIHNTKKCKDKG